MREAEHRKEMERARRAASIEKRYKLALFGKLVAKLQPNHRTLAALIPDQLQDFGDDGYVPMDVVARELLGWPVQKDERNGYTYQEISSYAKKHTKKFSFGLLAALLLYNRSTPAEYERLARYYQIDLKKLRKKAAEEVKQEEVKNLRARDPKVQTSTHKRKGAAA